MLDQIIKILSKYGYVYWNGFVGTLWISAVTVAVDMTADFFLIYGIGPFPRLEANGSAYSTVAV